ncbi:hypothetical protein BVRB_018730 [Beta vulgaris subsp. vulgaris]|uniref:Uncharacterized protein n=1 Tax=Beta vulgaris subsp. vulgaris TaxID=3555 RepID=A0A0J8BFJ0_BETVV|nr:hypothetical protein BVRB_018730 [Beta vulgaris subsp. vulgaris]
MRGRTRMNAMRSGLVVVGALAFGYLTLQIGFKPFLLKAQQTLELEKEKELQQQQQQQQQPSFDFPDSSSPVRN